MTGKLEQLKKQRDRFLAFSFASADLLIEISEEGTVTYTLGAARSITGFNDGSLIGQNWLELFSKSDKVTLMAMRSHAKNGKRRGPYLVTLDEKIGGGKQAIVTGIKMPDDESFYLTVSFSNVLMARAARSNEEKQGNELLDKEKFLTTASETLNLAKMMGQEVDMTLLDIEDPHRIKEQLGEDVWDSFASAIGNLLSSKSIDGHTAAEISEGRYSVIHDKSIDSDSLRDQLAILSKETDPEGDGFNIESKVVTADLEALSDRETAKALIYTINEFERKGTDLTIETLNSGFKSYVSANAQKITQFKHMIEQLNFNLHFQPVVNLDTFECEHYEMLSRFDGEGTTEEWVIFGEDIGMAAEFDLAVCERAINYLIYKSQGRSTKFAVNLSGQSLQNEQFFLTLIARLQIHNELNSRLIFEITESTLITELEKVNHFVSILQKDGYTVCLDDFGAGSASFQYLHKLHVDFVKIDGQYTQKVLESNRDAVMIKNMSQMCRDLGVEMIAERIENIEQAEWMRDTGIKYGQGFLFSKATPSPEYNTPAKLRKHVR